MKKHRVLAILFWNLGIGGVQTKIVDIARELSRKDSGVGTCHIVLRDQPAFRLDGRVRSRNSRLHYRPRFLWGRLQVPFTIYSIYTLVTLRPDVILTFLDHASFIALIASRLIIGKSVRVVLNEDTYTTGHTVSRIKRVLVRLLYPLADTIISPTEASKNDLASTFGIPAGRIRVCPNWTLTPETKPKPPECDLLYIGRFDRQKNLFFLLDAVRTLRKTNNRLRLRMVGEGMLREPLAAHLDTHHMTSYVDILPSTHDVPDNLTRTKLFAITSHYEGMPVALLEAMASRVPVVALEYPGIGEYITHERTGLIATSKSGFVRNVRIALASRRLRNTLAANAASDVRRRFGHGAVRRFISIMLGDS